MKAESVSRRLVSHHLLVIPAAIVRRWEPIITGERQPRAVRDGRIPGFSQELTAGYAFDLNICPSSSSDEPPLVDAVLLQDGQDVASACYERLLGAYELNHGNRTFAIEVIAEPTSWARGSAGGRWLAAQEGGKDEAYRQSLIDQYTAQVVSGGTRAAAAARRLAQFASS